MEAETEKKKYIGETGGQGYDGFAGLLVGQAYTGTIEGGLSISWGKTRNPGFAL